MSDADFLARIIADPGSDAERLIYADWLEERGDAARAEFIRVQVELAPLLAEWGEPQSKRGADMTERQRQLHRQFVPLQVRELELLSPHRHEWSAPALAAAGGSHGWVVDGRRVLHRLSSGGDAELHFRRGFVEHVALTSADWLGHADALLAAAPIREVALTDVPAVYLGHPDDGYTLDRVTAWPVVHADGNGYAVVVSAPLALPIAGRLLSDRWPGVKFNLPG